MDDELILLRWATVAAAATPTDTHRKEQVRERGARKHLDNNHDCLLTVTKGLLLPKIRWIGIELWTYILYSRVLVTQVVFYSVTETFLNMKLFSSTKLWKQLRTIVRRVTPACHLFTFWSLTTVLYETTPTFKLRLLAWSQLHTCKVVKWTQHQPPSCLVNIKAYFPSDSFVDLLFLWCFSCGAASVALATGHRFNFN